MNNDILEEKPLAFLTQEWIYEVTRVVQGARAKDEELRKYTSDYSLNLAYVITDLPEKLKEIYTKSAKAVSEKIVLFIKLDKGVVQKLEIGIEIPQENIDFTIYSTHDTAKKIFTEKLNPASAFIRKQLKVEPIGKIYKMPRFTAKSIITGNMILKYARLVPTDFQEN